MAQLSLAWIMSRKGIFFSPSFYTVISFLTLKKKKIQGVSAPIVGTTSLENLYDLLGILFYFIFRFIFRFLILWGR